VTENPGVGAASTFVRERVTAAFCLLSFAFVAGCAPAAIERDLGLAGHDNATPFLASDGSRVVLAWTASQDGRTNVFVATSQDAGATFSEPRRVNDRDGDARASGEQGPRVALTPRAITVLWTSRDAMASVLRVAESRDDGRSFTPATTLSTQDATGARGWGSLVAAEDGRLHAVWLDGRHAEPHQHGGAPANGPAPLKLDERRRAPRQDLFHQTWLGSLTSPDAGSAGNQLVADNVCFCCKTAVVAGPGGRVYAAWRHIFPGSVRDIAFAMSSDGGRSFDPPRRVSEDNWQIEACPDDGPALAVDASGGLHIAWPTAVAGSTAGKAIFYAYSPDGRSFSARVQLNDPDATAAAHPHVAIAADGRALVVWDDLLNRTRRVLMRRVGRPAGGQPGAIGRLEVLSREAGAYYPVVAVAGRRELVAWTDTRDTDSRIHLIAVGR
jgi:hypothetical protein